ncbi:Transcription factor domain-containing protein [Madurella fahalii]|uniref:Transcription factor domain-containing protein n=1 Tax=Madurella fahalii TaxID=1157608 RepID=A0ABQ0GTF6_9PEZI
MYHQGLRVWKQSSLPFPRPVPSSRASCAGIASTSPSHPLSSRAGAGSTSASTRASHSWSRDVESAQNNIRQLEEQLPEVATQRSVHSPASTLDRRSIEATTSRLGGTSYTHRQTSLSSPTQAIGCSITHKTLLFGQSHWIHVVSLFQDASEMIEPHLREEWPCTPTAELPASDLADELVDCYLRTIETVYRIQHIPTFMRDYEALWRSDADTDASFLVQLKLVLAIGATTYDERFSLRSSAIRWVYEAHTWLLEPQFKPRQGMRSLQTQLLLLLARETAGAGGESVCVSAGALLRRAVSIGLHRDPACLPKKTALISEMHRRLWNTVLEIALQLSLTSGAPPLLSLDDFNTEPPGNLDDEQLAANDPVAKPDSEFTQTSIVRVLRKMFPLRLAVAKLLNSLGSASEYKETLRLDAELRASSKDLRRDLQSLRYNSSEGVPSSRFDILAVDFLMHRYLSALHIPFVGLALQEAAYAFSRNVVTETSLKIWCAAYPSSSIVAFHRGGRGRSSSGRDDLARLALCGSGLYRTVATQAALLLAVEPRTQIQEEESFGPMPLRPDLLSVLNDAKVWCVRCIEAGETNIKGLLFMSVVAAQIEGLMQGLRGDELAKLMVSVSRRGEDRPQQVALDLPPEVVEDWDFMMSDARFSSDNTDLVGWLLNNDIPQPEF